MSDELEANDGINQQQTTEDEDTKADDAPETIVNEDTPVDDQAKEENETAENDVQESTGTIGDCFLCKKQLNDPRSLACIHSFCIGCLKEHIDSKNKNDAMCPVCASSIPDNLEDLSVDPLVEKVLKCQSSGNDVQCSLCSSNATQRCTNCEHFLCNRDAERHQLIPATKDHECIQIDEYQKLNTKDRLALQIVYCSVHPQAKVDVYCRVCDVFICMACNVIDHQRAKHDVEPVADYVDRLTPKLKKVADELHKQSKISDQTMSNINQAIDKLQPLKEQASADIKKLCSELREKIDKCEIELNEKLEEKYQNKYEAMKNLLSHTNDSSCNIKSLIEYIECLVGSRNCELLRHATSNHIKSFEKTVKSTKHAGKVVSVTEVLKIVINEQNVGSVNSENLCCFKISDVSPEHSSFSRVTDAKTGELKTITVTTKNEDGNASVADPAPSIEIIDSEKKVIATPTLESHKNGTYQFSWLPTITGTFGVKIHIDGKQIKGSPFRVTVSKGSAINKNKNAKKPPTNSKKVK
ncbi:tripartite motif-containing protein 2-like [Anneissia japonica]|uniref:tripartite motif-containing protein 2-like n=1 Tax=Anneissia japonica TaxID=1529436 RepID=UPI0014256556|nr:tripartite motif-containing protein 2-like [Anneissia japonica]